jgi:hypothetical protein
MEFFGLIKARERPRTRERGNRRRTEKKPEGDEQTKMKSKRHALPKVSCIVV